MNDAVNSFTVRLTMESDWHIGTGAGRPGNVDKLVTRDTDGFPYVPAKTLNGIWRDAMERLTFALDEGKNDGPWSKWVVAIFGAQPGIMGQEELNTRVADNGDTYSHSMLSVRPAHLSEELRGKINSLEDIDRLKLLAAITFVKPGVEIDADSGTSRPEHLRFEEMARAGAVLEARCELDLSDVEHPDSNHQRLCMALLGAGAGLIECIGGKRRRGAGRCSVEVLTTTVDFIDELQKYGSTPPQPPKVRKKRQALASLARNAQNGVWRKFKYRLDLKTPVSIVTATLGNVAESLDFIPGTYLLPHFTQLLSAKFPQYLSAVAYGDFQVSPATVELAGERGLPVPRAIFYEKVGGGFEKLRNSRSTVYSLFTEEDRIEDTSVQKKAFRAGFVSSVDSQGTLPQYDAPKKTLSMHNVIEDRLQRPSEEVGGVFSREAIPAGSVLRGEIRTRDEKLADALSAEIENANKSVRLGTSRKDDYGLVDLAIESEIKPAEIKGNGGSSEVSNREINELIVYLESDVLLRNSNLRQTNMPGDLERELTSVLNALAPELCTDVELETRRSVIHTRRVESWHEGWRLPRPTLAPMAAGSCAFLTVNGITPDKKDAWLAVLDAIEESGIGERRGEGYGRLRFNPPLLSGKLQNWSPDPRSTTKTAEHKTQGKKDKPLLLKDSDQAFAKLIEKAAWRDELNHAVLKAADDYETRKKIFGFDSDSGPKGEPPMSQIGGLRSAINRLRAPGDSGIVARWLDHLADNRNRSSKWKLEKIKNIKVLVSEPDKVWLTLCETLVADLKVWRAPATLTRTPSELREELWGEAVRSLFDACARAHKRDVENRGKGDKDGATHPQAS